MIHGIYCNTKTFPLNCYNCDERVFFFSCDHESRVFFDELGPPWPLHNCFNEVASQVDDSPSVQPSLLDINHYRGSRQHTGLLPGLRSGADSIDAMVVRRVSQSRTLTREIMKIDPMGEHPINIVGVVQQRSQPDLARRYHLDRNSIGFGELTKVIGEADPAQLTVFVDELSDDPAAIDYFSYTFLLPKCQAGKSISKNTVIKARLVPVYILGIGKVWLAKDIEQMY